MHRSLQTGILYSELLPRGYGHLESIQAVLRLLDQLSFTRLAPKNVEPIQVVDVHDVRSGAGLHHGHLDQQLGSWRLVLGAIDDKPVAPRWLVTHVKECCKDDGHLGQDHFALSRSGGNEHAISHG